MFEEEILEVVDDGAGGEVVVVAPVLGVLGVSVPGVGDAHATDEAGGAVGDHEFAVGAVVEASQGEPAEGTEVQHLNSGGPHAFGEAVVHLEAADPIENDADIEACAGFGGEGIGEAFSDGPAPVDEGFEKDGVLRGINRVEHGGEDLISVAEEPDGAAAML